MVLAGVAGVGKSRLLTEVAAAWPGEVMRISGSASASLIPFGAFASVVPDLGGFGEGAGVVALLAGFEAALQARSSGALLVAVDDAQHLDTGSMALVHRLAVGGLAHVACTVRTGDPVRADLTDLWASGVALRLELQPLARDEADLLAEVGLGGPVEPVTLDRLWGRTHGNPLFLRLVVLGAGERGQLRAERGWWSWDGDETPDAPIVELVEVRLGRLEPRDRTALEVVALAEGVAVEVVAAIAPGSDLAGLEQRSLLRTEEVDGRIELRLAHPLYGEVLRARLGLLRLRELERALADELEGQGPLGPEATIRVARWRLHGGGTPSEELLLDAARRAMERYDFRLADELARAAVERTDSADARWEHARALVGSGQHEEAERVLAAAAAEAANEHEVHRVADARSRALFWHAGDADRALVVLEEAEAKLTDPDLIASLRSDRSLVLANAGRIAEAIAVGEPLLDHPDIWCRVRAVSGAGFGFALHAEGDRAIGLISTTLPDALAGATEHPDGPGWVAVVWMLGLISTGRLSDVDQLLQVLPSGSAHATYTGAEVLLRGRLALLQGLAPEAARFLHRSAEELAVTNGSWRPWSLALLAEAHALVGEVDLAEAAIAESIEGWPTLPGAWAVDARRCGAWVHASAGRLSQAQTELLAVADDCRSTGSRYWEALALHDHLRIAATEPVAVRLRELAEEAEGAWIPALAAHARAALSGDGHALDAATDQLEATGALLHAAEASAQAATAHRAAGLRAREAAATTRSAALRERCGPVRTPGLFAATGAPELTAREREVVALVRRGLSNREIAAAMVVSVRTVEGHVLRASAKVGASSRTELVELLGPLV